MKIRISPLISRRRAMQTGAAAVLAQPLMPTANAQRPAPGLPQERTDTPKITLWLQDLEEASMRRIRQLGVTHVCMGGPALPWSEAEIRSCQQRLGTQGLKLALMMFSGFPKAIYGKPGRD